MIIGMSIGASTLEIEDAYRGFAGDLLRAVRARTGGAGEDDVADAAAYAWSVLARRPDVLASDTWRGWLCVVAVRECRRAVRERAMVLELAHDVVHESDPLVDLDARERLHAALGRVDEGKRAELLLVAAGYSYAEVAELLGVTRTHVDRSVKEGRAMARGELATPTRLPAPRGSGGGRRYHPRYRTTARRLRLEGYSYPEIKRELGCSLRTAMVWAGDVAVRYLRRRCAHCKRDFQWPVAAHGVPRYCGPSCARYAFSLRRHSRART